MGAGGNQKLQVFLVFKVENGPFRHFVLLGKTLYMVVTKTGKGTLNGAGNGTGN